MEISMEQLRTAARATGHGSSRSRRRGSRRCYIRSSDGNDGASPQAGLIQAADGNFYGTTGYGGPSNVGTVFKITPAGVETALYSFTAVTMAEVPQRGLFQAADGNFYGTTVYGGASTWARSSRSRRRGSRRRCIRSPAVTMAEVPQRGCFRLRMGICYGTTVYGGASNVGTVFKF